MSFMLSNDVGVEERGGEVAVPEWAHLTLKDLEEFLQCMLIQQSFSAPAEWKSTLSVPIVACNSHLQMH